jgi:hypothetical protein
MGNTLVERGGDMKRTSFLGRRTKIVCTLGPATSAAAVIECKSLGACYGNSDVASL